MCSSIAQQVVQYDKLRGKQWTNSGYFGRRSSSTLLFNGSDLVQSAPSPIEFEHVIEIVECSWSGPHVEKIPSTWRRDVPELESEGTVGGRS
jgi:hypothetical protein